MARKDSPAPAEMDFVRFQLPLTLKQDFEQAVKRFPDQDMSKVLRAFMRDYVSKARDAA